MLPPCIEREIFTLSSVAGDPALDYICDIIECLGYCVKSLDNMDCAIAIYLCRAQTDVELRIDRIARTFEAAAFQNGYTIMPVCGSWNDVLRYLEGLHNAV